MAGQLGSWIVDCSVGGEPGSVELHMDLINQRYECIGVTVWSGVRPSVPDKRRRLSDIEDIGDGPRPLTAAALRVPFAAILQNARRAMHEEYAARTAVDGSKRARDQRAGKRPGDDPVLDALFAGANQGPRRRSHDLAHWEEVARVYSEAWKAGIVPPREAVRQHFHISASMAGKWIHKLRREPLCLLPPTTPGKAGLGPDESTTIPRGRRKQ